MSDKRKCVYCGRDEAAHTEDPDECFGYAPSARSAAPQPEPNPYHFGDEERDNLNVFFSGGVQ